jgi:riboflavin synthase
MIGCKRMFTGIIKEIGTVLDIKKIGKNRLFKVASKLQNKLQIGSSIAINGVCTTIINKTPKYFEFEIMPETLDKTNLGSLKANSKANLESSLRLGDDISGHFVLGHVDTTAKLKKLKKYKDYSVFEIETPKQLKKFIALKGSITINGVSLTVSEIKEKTFEISLIPFTLKHTILGTIKENDELNIEVDVFARYIENFKQNVKI